MTDRPSRTLAVVFAVALVAIVLVGCRGSAPAVKRAERAADALVDARRSLVAAEQTVGDAQVALRTLSGSKGDLRPAFEAFVVRLEAVEATGTRLAGDRDRVKADADAYCDARKDDVATIVNPELRKAAVDRTAAFKRQCDDLDVRYNRVNAAAGAYVRDLTDLRTYLSNELNYAALDGGQRWVTAAVASGERLRGEIRELALRADQTSNLLSPVPIPTTRWPTTLPGPAAATRPAGP